MSKESKLGIKHAHPVDDLKGLNLLTGPVGDDFIIPLKVLYPPQVRSCILENIFLPAKWINTIFDYMLLDSESVDSIFSSGILHDIKVLISAYPQLANYRNAAGQTPLDIAFNKEVVDSKTVKYLIMNEAKLSNFWDYYSGIRDKSCDPSIKEGLEYYINAPSLLTLTFLEKIFGAAGDIVSAYMYGDEGKADAGITLSTQLISLIDKILVQSDLKPDFRLNRKAYFEQAQNLIDRGAHTLIQKIDSYPSDKKLNIHGYHAIFSHFFQGGVPVNYGLSDSEFGLYEKLYQSSPDYYTRFFLTLLLFDWKYISAEYTTGAIVSKLFNVYINAKADIDKVFFFAIKYRHLEIINNLEKCGLLKEINVNQRDCNRQTALYLAIVRGAPVTILRKLLEMKADVNYRYQDDPYAYDNFDPKKIEVSEKITGYRKLMTTSRATFCLGDSALHTAIREYLIHREGSRLSTISTLLESAFKADANLKNGWDETPLHVVMRGIGSDSVVSDQRAPVISMLLEAKADMNISYKDKSPLYLAVQLGHKPFIHLFFKYGNDLLFKKFLEFYSTGFWNTLFKRGMAGQLNSTGESKITTMSGVMNFFKRKVEEGETPGNTAAALQELAQHILQEGGVRLSS
jgi:ankyrin repeat protein